MCLILLGYHVHPLYRLILIANRDEFYARETAPLNFWEDHPDVLGRRDLEQMGTWLWVSRSGRVAACQTSNDIDIEPLFKILADDTPAPDDLLPDTGIELAWERILSAILIKSPHYGTRSSSIILIDHQNYVQFWERSHPPFDSSKIRSETRYLAFKHRRSV